MLVDKIKNIVPEAEIDESGILTVTVEPAKYRELALRLKGDRDLSFDFMICMTGNGLGRHVRRDQPVTIHGSRA